MHNFFFANRQVKQILTSYHLYDFSIHDSCVCVHVGARVDQVVFKSLSTFSFLRQGLSLRHMTFKLGNLGWLVNPSDLPVSIPPVPRVTMHATILRFSHGFWGSNSMLMLCSKPFSKWVVFTDPPFTILMEASIILPCWTYSIYLSMVKEVKMFRNIWWVPGVSLLRMKSEVKPLGYSPSECRHGYGSPQEWESRIKGN